MRKYIFIILLFIFCCPQFSQALVLNINSKSNVLPTGQKVEISISLDTQNVDINALEGDLLLPSGISVVDVLDASEVISFWLEKPASKENKIHFSGMTPGGFKGQGILFRALVIADKNQKADFSLANLQVLLNDGQGTATVADSNILTVDFVSEASSSYEAVEVTVSDHEMPESFTPMISRLDQIEPGIFFLVFDTQDKGTGIDHYEVREGWRLYESAESPYRLKNQKLNDDIYVKVFDKAGNQRVVKVLAFNDKYWYEKIEFYGIILLVIFVYFILRKKLQPNAIRNTNKKKYSK